MNEQNHGDKSRTADVRNEVPAVDVEAAILAGGVIVGTTVEDDLLVEGPNSK